MERKTDSGGGEESLLEALGIRPAFVDDEGVSGPPVDREKLRSYLKRELGPHATEEVTAIVSSFRTWYETLCELIRAGEAGPTQGK